MAGRKRLLVGEDVSSGSGCATNVAAFQLSNAFAARRGHLETSLRATKAAAPIAAVEPDHDGGSHGVGVGM